MARTLDSLALAGLSAVLLVAFYYQIVIGEFPCPLCLLQRVGFIVAGVGLMLNLTQGPKPANYGLMILAAVVAGSASLRQISLHIVPNTGVYGSALWGFHFYTWAFIGYGALVLYAATMLIVVQFGEGGDRVPARAASVGAPYETAPKLSGAAKLACWVFTALIGANVLAALAECGLGPCPDNPTGWLWSK